MAQGSFTLFKIQTLIMPVDKGKDTIKAMLRIYCQAHHGRDQGLCAECDSLKQYVGRRLDNCPFGQDKPVCSKCRVNCYSSEKRILIRNVMLFSGPKMISSHPVLAVKHFLSTLRNPK